MKKVPKELELTELETRKNICLSIETRQTKVNMIDKIRTCSGIKDCNLLILPLFFILVKPLQASTIPGKKCPIKSANPISSAGKFLYSA